MCAASSCCSTMDMRGFLVGVSKYCCHRSYSTDSRFCIMSNLGVQQIVAPVAAHNLKRGFLVGVPRRCCRRANCTPSLVFTKHVHAVEQLSVALCSRTS